ncbi:MAG: CPBP family intramembrane metalloprotease [Planctomycetota bacterium]|nr:CPBP family intramembrane metalloprotease [Planctomycetota bacterium]
MTQHSPILSDENPAQDPIENLGRWRRFRTHFAGELRWNPVRSRGELARAILTGVPALWFLNFMVAGLGKAMGIQAGTDDGPILEMIRENPGLILFMGVVVAPLSEELIFRVLPRALGKTIRPNATTMWPLGVLCTVLFALAHINPDNPTVPLPQFVTGLALWAMQSRFGYMGSVILHACFNASLLIPAILFMGTPQ